MPPERASRAANRASGATTTRARPRSTSSGSRRAGPTSRSSGPTPVTDPTARSRSSPAARAASASASPRALPRDGWDLASAGVRPGGGCRRRRATLSATAPRALRPGRCRERRRSRARSSTTSERVVGVPSALVNNAGRAPRVRADLLEATEESFDELVRTNLRGPYFLTQAVAREMIAAASAVTARRGDRLHHVGLGRDGVAKSRRVLRQQGGLAMAVKLFARASRRTASRSTRCGPASSRPT